jgi:MFS family permease
LGAIFFSIPHFKTEDYKPLPDIPKQHLMQIGLCRTSQFPCVEKSVESSHMALFVIGQIMIGLGLAPLYCLVPAYIDEIINPKKMPLAMLLWYANISVGPVIGLVAGGIFQQFYIDIDQVLSRV